MRLPRRPPPPQADEETSLTGAYVSGIASILFRSPRQLTRRFNHCKQCLTFHFPFRSHIHRLQTPRRGSANKARSLINHIASFPVPSRLGEPHTSPAASLVGEWLENRSFELFVYKADFYNLPGFFLRPYESSAEILDLVTCNIAQR